MDRDRENSNDHYVVLADEEFLDRLEAENTQLRKELDALWKFLAETFEGRFVSSRN
jgi:hypothetical protein